MSKSETMQGFADRLQRMASKANSDKNLKAIRDEKNTPRIVADDAPKRASINSAIQNARQR